MRCHDPHYTPPEASRIEYYRGKCVACHGEPFAAKHHPETKDCIGCHMPFVPSSLAHTQATDHRILKHAMAMPVAATTQLMQSQPLLKPFPDIPQTRNDARSFGLAWQSLAEAGQPGALPIAHKYLLQAAAANENDSSVLASLGYIAQQQGELKQAAELYQHALKANSSQLDALTNLGVLEANGGDFSRAVGLWKTAFELSPYKSAIGLNLAVAYCKQQNYKQAENITLRVLEFNPDLPVGKALLSGLMHEPPECGAGK
jgi:tetratricopeptide (TPR) repeat protein